MSQNIITTPNGARAGVTSITDFQNYKGSKNTFDPFSDRSLYTDFPDVDAILQPRKSSYTPTTLGQTTKIYVGSQDDIIALALWGNQQQYQFSYGIEELPNQLFQITFTIPYDEITYADVISAENSQFELITNVTTRNIFDAGIYYVLANTNILSEVRYTVPPLLQAAINYAVKNNGDLLINQQTCGDNYDKFILWSNIANQFVALLRAGVTGVQSHTSTLRRTAVYSVNDPNAFDNQPTFGNPDNLSSINQFISTNDLIDYYQVPSTDADALPASYSRYKTLAVANPLTGYADPITLFAYGGWLVQSPTKTFITPTKVQINQLFQFDEWLDNLYKTPSPSIDFPLAANTPYPTQP